MTDQTPTPPNLPSSAGKRPVYTRWWFIVLAVLVGIVVLAGIFGNGTGGDGNEAGGTTTTESGSVTTETQSVTTTVASTTTTTEATTTTQSTTTTTLAPAPTPDPVTFSGSGKEVVEFDDTLVQYLSDNIAVFHFSISGSGNNVVWALDAAFDETDLLVNTIGDQSGTRWLALQNNPVALEVDAGGAWELTISRATKLTPVSVADDFWVTVVDTTDTYAGALTEVIDGKGPDALFLQTQAHVVDITADGDGNIVMWGYSAIDGSSELLMNEIDTFDGSSVLPDCSQGCLIDVDGDYTYTLTVRS